MNRRPSESDLIDFRAQAFRQIEERAEFEFERNQGEHLAAYLVENDAGVAAAAAIALCYRALHCSLNTVDRVEVVSNAREALRRIHRDFVAHRLDDAELDDEIDQLARRIADDMEEEA